MKHYIVVDKFTGFIRYQTNTLKDARRYVALRLTVEVAEFLIYKRLATKA